MCFKVRKIPKPVAGTDYVLWENLHSEEGVFGTEEDLEKWKAAVSDTESIMKIVIQNDECENRYLSRDEILKVIGELQSFFPTVYEEFENPATGGGYSIAAYGGDGKIL